MVLGYKHGMRQLTTGIHVWYKLVILAIQNLEMNVHEHLMGFYLRDHLQ